MYHQPTVELREVTQNPSGAIANFENILEFRTIFPSKISRPSELTDQNKQFLLD